ncbi:hypothetical protein [Nannocystis sp. SCPEA4]|uniref:hypothetical protein n=1 Tax=Nannocystis sp. SCPEA4 TaxID=2996787 RepID=UPI00226D78CD|nr:hypothetical protein [Nannocystis sp. SCPEA4]MCY1062637.1 hypothetical protein [Nannocystis sp. SCPEA4]
MQQPVVISEQELDRRHGTRARLASGGVYGCACAVYEGDLTVDGDAWLGDEHWSQLQLAAAPQDIGTIAVTGNLIVRGELRVSDRLMCAVVLGDLVARALFIFETEFYVGGDLRVDRLQDRDDYLTVVGERVVAEPDVTGDD